MAQARVDRNAPQTPAARADFTIDQDFDAYTPEDHATWRRLYEHQAALLQGRACNEFLEGLNALDLHGGGVPHFGRLSDALERLTGWRIVATPCLVPDAVFFEHLANRRFPAGAFIRRPDQIDYIQEPDVFHDVFGHVPMLANPLFADYMQAYGQGGLRSQGFDSLANLAALYWYTVEFGLIRTGDGLRLYGAGIASSPGETRFALESPAPHRVHFSLERVMRTAYRIDDFQQTYFVIDSFAELFDATLQDFAPIYGRLSGAAMLPADCVLEHDNIHWRGDQGRWRRPALTA